MPRPTFEYDSKKSGGVTKSHLRFGHEPIRSTYYVTMADFVACHKQSYMKSFDIVSEIKEGGTFLLNTDWDMAGLEEHLPNRAKRIIAQRGIKFYTIDATDIAARIGLGNRTNTVLQAAFFKLSGVMPINEAVEYMKQAIVKTYSKKGEKIVNMNCAAVDAGLDYVHEVQVPAAWADLKDEEIVIDPTLPKYIREIQIPVNNQYGDKIPVSSFMDYADGVSPVETSKYERRGMPPTSRSGSPRTSSDATCAPLSARTPPSNLPADRGREGSRTRTHGHQQGCRQGL